VCRRLQSPPADRPTAARPSRSRLRGFSLHTHHVWEWEHQVPAPTAFVRKIHQMQNNNNKKICRSHRYCKNKAVRGQRNRVLLLHLYELEVLSVCKETDMKNLSLLLKILQTERGRKFFPNLHSKFTQSLHLAKRTKTFLALENGLLERLLRTSARG